MKKEAALHGLPESWNQIVVEMENGFSRSLLQRLTLAASIYILWHERNHRIFQNRQRSMDQVTKEIKEVVLLRMTCKAF